MKKFADLFIFLLISIVGIILNFAQITVGNGIDKIYHFLGFSLLTLSFIKMSTSFSQKRFYNILLIAWLFIGTIIATAAEISQRAIPDRSFESSDWATNTLGIIFPLTFLYFLNLHRNKIKDENDL